MRIKSIIQNSLRFLFHFSASVMRDVSTVDEYILCLNFFPCQANDGASCNGWYQMEEIILGWPKSSFGFFRISITCYEIMSLMQ